MANTGIRQLTTVVGGYAKRIWYSLNGTTPINELMSIDDAGKFKCASEQITGLAGTGNRMVVADSTGNLSANGIIYKPIIKEAFNYTAIYGINYINSANGGQCITLPTAMPGVEIEIISKIQGVNTFFTMTGADKIYDIAGNDVTTIYTVAFALTGTKRIRLIGIQRDYWLVVEKVNA
jgi:hypothetical protein